MMNGYYGFGGGSMGFFGGFLWIIFWGIVIFLVIQLITQNSSAKKESKSAMDILKERYARGEITKAEFEEMKKNLM